MRQPTFFLSSTALATFFVVVLLGSSAEARCRQICWTKTTFVPKICLRCYNIGRNRVCSQYQCGSQRVYAGQECICG